jgi:hypothetical protein
MKMAEILSAIADLLWPLLGFAALLTFRRQLRDLVPRIKKGKLFGQEIELQDSLIKLDRSAQNGATEMARLPAAPEREKIESGGGDDPVARVMHEATRSPKLGLMLLATELERETREILATTGLLRGRVNMSLREGFKVLDEWGGLPRHIPSSLSLFSNVRNKIVHGRGASEDDILAALDSGVTLLRTLQAVPKSTRVVYHPGADVFSDSDGATLVQGLKAVILETESAGGTKTEHLVYPTTRMHFEKGMRVAWEWDSKHQWDECWYRDPDTNEIKYGWTSSMEFVGRDLLSL